MIYRSIVLVMLNVLLTHGSAQYSRISFSTPDSIPAYFYVQDSKLNNQACTALTLERSQSGRQTLVVEMQLEEPVMVSQSFELKENTHYRFELRKVKSKWMIVPVSEAPVLFRNAFAPQTINPDVSSAAQNRTVQGCEEPMGGIIFKEYSQELREIPAEARRYAEMKKAFEGKCIRTEQLRYLLSLLDLEENKMRLVEFTLSHISDPHRLSKIEEDFFLEKNKEVIRQLSQFISE